MEDVVSLVLGDIDFEPDALKAKYLEERDKRLRLDANEQFVEVTGEFSNYVDDPYEKRIDREPLNDRVEIVLIGGGFGGLLLGGRLREAGFDDIRVIEKGGDFGGTCTGIATRERCAMWNPIAIYPCCRSSTTSRGTSTPSHRKSWSTRRT